MVIIIRYFCPFYFLMAPRVQFTHDCTQYSQIDGNGINDVIEANNVLDKRIHNMRCSQKKYTRNTKK